MKIALLAPQVAAGGVELLHEVAPRRQKSALLAGVGELRIVRGLAELPSDLRVMDNSSWVRGQQFILEDLEDCEVLLLDHCAQVSCPRSILLRR